MRTLGAAMTAYEQVQLIALSSSRATKGSDRSNCFVHSHITFRPLARSARRDDGLSSSLVLLHHHAATSQQPTRTAKRAELVYGHFGLTMGRQHAGVLLALTVVLLLAAASDGIRPAPAAAGGNDQLAHGSTTAEMVVVAAPSAAQGRRRMSIRGGKDDDQLVLREEVVRATGSSLPDCSHACGACSPCSRVMVSFKCSAAEPLPCPMVYRCMCKGKCYPVPSS